MSRRLSLAMLMDLFAQETDEVIVPLLTLSHVEWEDSLRCAMNGVDFISRGLTFYAYPFDLVPPDDDPDRPSQATITIDNVSRQITAALELSIIPPTVTIELVRGSTPDVVEVSWENLTLREVKYNITTITGTLMFEDISKETYPNGSFTPGYFPGLY